ncbi:MAG: hypothetical protein OEL84_01320 [Nitrosopumilus sp.]|nr:hypothetical protein [Nitrosopumilus sp.]
MLDPNTSSIKLDGPSPPKVSAKLTKPAMAKLTPAQKTPRIFWFFI